MKKKFVIPIVAVVLLAIGYFVAAHFAVRIINDSLQKAVGPGLSISHIRLSTTHLSGIGVQFRDKTLQRELLKIKEVRVFPAILTLLSNTIKIRTVAIDSPDIFLSRTSKGIFHAPLPVPEKSEKTSGASEEHITIQRIVMNNGSVSFEDHMTGSSPAEIELRDVALSLENIKLPVVEARSPIELKAKIPGRGKDGSVKLNGWIDLNDMNTSLSLTIKSVTIRNFEPYYRKSVSAAVQSGYATVTTKITIKGHSIDVPGELQLDNLRLSEQGMFLYLPAYDLNTRLQQRGNKLNVPFHVTGNLSDPKFNFQQTLFLQLAKNMADSLGISSDLQSLIKNFQKNPEAVKKSLEDFFKQMR